MYRVVNHIQDRQGLYEYKPLDIVLLQSQSVEVSDNCRLSALSLLDKQFRDILPTKEMVLNHARKKKERNLLRSETQLYFKLCIKSQSLYAIKFCDTKDLHTEYTIIVNGCNRNHFWSFKRYTIIEDEERFLLICIC